MRRSNPDPVYVRAAAGTSPVVALAHPPPRTGAKSPVDKPFFTRLFGNILPVIATLKTLSGRPSTLRISFRRHDIQSGPRV